MSQPKNFPNQIRTRLLESDMSRFREFVAKQDTNEASFARQALLFYMDALDRDELNRIESVYSQQVKSSTNRICALLSKVAMDVRAIYFFLGEDEPEHMEQWRNKARKLINRTLTQEELDLALKMAVKVSEALNENTNNSQT